MNKEGGSFMYFFLFIYIIIMNFKEINFNEFSLFYKFLDFH